MSDEFVTDLAVVIGIGAYSSNVGTLETPVRDAEAVAKLLENRFGYEVILRRDGEATLEKLKELLYVELKERVREESRLLFYFAGHGVAQDSIELEGPRGFLVPQDATSDVRTQLPMEDVREALAGLPCRHLLVILDCCFSGAFHWAGRRPTYVPGELLYEERYQHWVRHRARWALASAAHDEYALDVADRRRGQVGSHSPFAAALLAGLQGEADLVPAGGDGVITLAELYAYVQLNLAPHQSPVLAPLKGQTRGEYVFRDPKSPLALRSAEVALKLEPELNPYRGLKPYRIEDAVRFFGRGEATRLLRGWMKAHPWSVVVGPSGSGKSSLVHAGLLPSLSDDPKESWTVPTPIRVAANPLASLREALAVADGPAVGEDLRDTRKAEAWAAQWATAHPGGHLLLVVDQAEELVTRVPRSGTETEPESLLQEAAQFLASLAALVRGGGGRVRAMVVVRSDYETDLDDGPHSSLWKAGRFIVPPLRREDLREITEGPAASRALYFDDPALVDRLVDEVWGMPGGLPLLSYALSQLFLAYVKDSRGDRLLTARDLQAIGGEPGDSEKGTVAPGGIVRVLRKGADQAVAELPDDHHRSTLWRVLLRMVNLVGTRTTRRQVPKDELVYPEEEENRRVQVVRDHFIDEARLLVSDQDDNRDLIEPAHDELLVAWPELVWRIDEARVHLPVHRRLTEAAAEWSAPAEGAPGGKSRKRELDLRLLGLVETSGLPKDWLNKPEADYVAAARRARRRRTALRWTVGVATLLVTTGAALFFRYQSQRNERLRYQAIIQNLTNQAEDDLGENRTEAGLLLTLQAFAFLPQSRGTLANPFDHLVRSVLDTLLPPRDNDQENRIHGLLRQALDDLPPSRIMLRLSPGDLKLLAFHPSGLSLAGGLAGKLNLVTLPPVGLEPTSKFFPVVGGPPDEKLTSLAFSSDGKLLAAGFDGGSICVWRLAGAPPVPIRGDSLCTPAAGRGIVTSLAFRPGAPIFVVGRESGYKAGNLQVWEVTDGPDGSLWLDRRSERSAPGAVVALAVSESELFVSIKDPSQLVRGPIDDSGPRLQQLKSPTDRTIDSLALESAGRFLVGTTLGKILTWQLPSGAGPKALSRKTDVSAWAVNHSSSNLPAAHLVTVDSDGTLSRIGGSTLTAETGTRSLCIGSAEAVAVEPTGGRVAIVCDGVLRLWDLRPMPGGWIYGVGRIHLSLAGLPTSLAIEPGSSYPLAIGFSDGNVQFWKTPTRRVQLETSSEETSLKWLRPSIQRTAPGTEVRAILWSSRAGYSILGNEGMWWRTSATKQDVPQWLEGPVCAASGSADGAWLAALISQPLSSALLKIWPASGAENPALLPSQRREGYFCDPSLAFHPTRTELAVGEDRDVILWSLNTEGQWQPRHLAEVEGRIYAMAWSGDLLAVGGWGISLKGSVTLLDGHSGEILNHWTISGPHVTRLAFDPGGQNLVASTDDGVLRMWNLKNPEARPLVLSQSGIKIKLFGFLEPDRLVTLTDRETTIWKLGIERLVGAACSTLSENLGPDSWTSYVDTDLSQYKPACPELGPNPLLLTTADVLAETGNEAAAREIYDRLNTFKPGTIVHPFRRAYCEHLIGKLRSFRGLNRKDVLSAMEQAEEYERLRQREGLPELEKGIQLMLCRRGALMGEPARALSFCDNSVKLFRGLGMAHDSRGLARALVGDLWGAREDFLASQDWQEDQGWRAQRRKWIDSLANDRNPITPRVLLEIVQEERGMTVDNVARPGGHYFYTYVPPEVEKPSSNKGTETNAAAG